MRNIQKLIAFVFVLLVWSCTTDDFSIQEKENGVSPKNNNPTNANRLVYSNTTLIVQYKPGTTNSEKSSIRISHGINGSNSAPQQGFGIYEICRCDDQDIEKWQFKGGINVEPKKQVIEDDIDEESTTGLLDVDYEFIFGLDLDSPYIGTDSDTGYTSYIKALNPGITIAVLDTGIATGLTVFNGTGGPHEFLYDASDTAVGGELSGWDFVNNDANAFDDDTGKHGSIVSYQIHDVLTDKGIPHQILPIKVSNNLGKASYFNFLCGSQYAFERADIVHMSLGWYDDGFGDHVNSIFSNILDTFSSKVLVTSAGNAENDNDEVAHFPSSYTHDNVIAVASSNGALSKISQFSNHGITSVDFFAQGEEIPFYDVFVQGTSFAAPRVTIEVARLLYVTGAMSPTARKAQLASDATLVTPSFTYVYSDVADGYVYRNILHSKLVIPFD
ncbi:Intracellular serine protease [Kordia antarctica]|uniref:Intracellular serine protease n=1 Tax=Kordia antarctica TaxID=1218801 RepID=A0A7L4ZGZ7_9FLAO|nr:S8/S53 family peptidase [Kordia antarctica]QHI35905.1 Intracellular serine protease [Kordia antarctica]